MALSTYSDLQTAVANWLRRNDLAAAIPDFIALAEVRFSRELRLRSMETTATGTASGQTIAEPADLLKLQRLAITVSGAERELEYMSPKSIGRYAGYTSTPQFFTTMNQQIVLGPAADASYPYTIYYIAKVPALSSSNATNAILTNAPDVYLYAALLEAAPYLKDDARVTLWANAYQNAVQNLIQQDNEQQFPDTSLVVKSDVRL